MTPLQLLLNAIEYHRPEFKAPLPAGLEDAIRLASQPATNEPTTDEPRGKGPPTVESPLRRYDANGNLAILCIAVAIIALMIKYLP